MNSSQLLEASMIVALSRIAMDRANEAANKAALSILPIAVYGALVESARAATASAGLVSGETLKLYISYNPDQAQAARDMEYDVLSQTRVIYGLDS